MTVNSAVIEHAVVRGMGLLTLLTVQSQSMQLCQRYGAIDIVNSAVIEHAVMSEVYGH